MAIEFKMTLPVIEEDGRRGEGFIEVFLSNEGNIFSFTIARPGADFHMYLPNPYLTAFIRFLELDG